MVNPLTYHLDQLEHAIADLRCASPGTAETRAAVELAQHHMRAVRALDPVPSVVASAA